MSAPNYRGYPRLSMAIETELKLRIAPQHLAKLKRHPLFKEHQLARPVSRRLYNVYFDTPELDLHESKMALRLRRSGKQWLQTLKGGGGIKGGLHQRNEWEFPVHAEALEFDHPDAAEWDALLPRAWRTRLHALFVTDFQRSSRVIAWRGAQIEVCMDQGEITAGERRHEICELELELKSGEPRQLFELAITILDIVPVALEVVNKAEYGFRLLGNYTEQPAKSSLPKVTHGEALTDSIQTLIWSCMLHLQRNWRGALLGEDAEFLHQVRVAGRRLRVLLQLLQQLRSDETLECLNAELADLTLLLGRIRDWDVFVTETLAGMEHMQGLLREGERQRARSHDALRAQTGALQSLMLRLGLWMNSDYWQRLERHAPKTQDFAARRLNKLAHRLALSIAQLDDADADQLHELRIQAKKLRYTSEACAVWFDDKHAATFISALAEVQQVLGKINDAAVAGRLLAELDITAQAEAVCQLQDKLIHALSGQHAALRHALKHFDKQKIFWRA